MFAVIRPRPIQSIARGLGLVAIAIGLAACAGGGGISGGYNPTTPTNTFDPEVYKAAEIKTIVIASVNLGSPSRKYLRREEARVDAQVAEHLREAGYTILPQREFSQRWNNAVLTFGNPIDPTTGRVNTNSFIQILQTVRQQMVEQTDVDAFLFTDLVEREVTFTQGVSRVARWDGVTRKPALQGPGQGVSAEFDWGRPISAATIRVALYDRDLNKVFDGAGGMDTTEAVDTRSGLAFVRRKDILPNENFIDEGIAIATHPWIAMANWPGNAPQ